MRARLVRISELIESVGLPNVKEPHVRHVRALYITAREQRVVIVRAFIKKTQKTPTAEIDLALQRAKEVKA
jgi:phage-related protein